MEQKKFVKVSLTTEKFREYVGMIDEEVSQFMNTDPTFSVFQLNDINEWGAFNVYKTLAEITVLTAARTLQGKEIRDSMTKGFAALYSDLDHGFTPLHWMFENLPLPSYRKRDIAHAKMSEFYQNILRNRRAGNVNVRSFSVFQAWRFSCLRIPVRGRCHGFIDEAAIPRWQTCTRSRNRAHDDRSSHGRAAH